MHIRLWFLDIHSRVVLCSAVDISSIQTWRDLSLMMLLLTFHQDQLLGLRTLQTDFSNLWLHLSDTSSPPTSLASHGTLAILSAPLLWRVWRNVGRTTVRTQSTSASTIFKVSKEHHALTELAENEFRKSTDSWGCVEVSGLSGSTIGSRCKILCPLLSNSLHYLNILL